MTNFDKRDLNEIKLEEDKQSSSGDSTQDGEEELAGVFDKSETYQAARTSHAAAAAAAAAAEAEAADSEPVDDPTDMTPAELVDELVEAGKGDAFAKIMVEVAHGDKGLMNIGRQLELLGAPPEATEGLRERYDSVAEDIRKALAGDVDARARAMQELTGHTMTASEKADFSSNPIGTFLGDERQFQLMGMDTRPQEHLDRGVAIREALAKAREGDFSGLDGLGVDLSKVNIDSLVGSEAGSMLDAITGITNANTPASPGIAFPGIGVVGGGSGSQGSSSTSTSASGGPSSDATAGPTVRGGRDPVFGDDGGSTSDDSGPGTTDMGGGDEKGEPMHDTVDADPGTSDDMGGGDEVGDASAMQTNDLPPAETAGGSGENEGGPAETTYEFAGSSIGPEGSQTYGYTQVGDVTAKVVTDRQDTQGNTVYTNPNAAGSDDDSTEYVDNDPGGYSNTGPEPPPQQGGDRTISTASSGSGGRSESFSSGKITADSGNLVVDRANAPIEITKRVATGDGIDPADPNAQSGELTILPEADAGTNPNVDNDPGGYSGASGTGTITRHVAPIDTGNPIDPNAPEGPTLDGTNPNDPGIYSGTAAMASVGPLEANLEGGVAPSHAGFSAGDVGAQSGGLEPQGAFGAPPGQEHDDAMSGPDDDLN
jgi:hypothetical protein